MPNGIRRCEAEIPAPALDGCCFYLVKQRPDLTLPNFVLTKPLAKVGRMSKCDFVLNTPSISREHAEVHVECKKFVVQDLDSLNGTFVNGQRINREVVTPGSVVRFAGISYLLQMIDDKRLGTSESTWDGESTPPAVTLEQEIVKHISAAQLAVAELAAQALTEKVIASTLGLSRHTVHNHLRALYSKFNVRSRAELVAVLLKKVPT